MKEVFKNTLRTNKGRQSFLYMVGGLALMFVIAMFHLENSKIKTIVMIALAFVVYFMGNRFNEALSIEIMKQEEKKEKRH